jgi:hypothetical protein
MADRNEVEQIVERVVSQALQGHFTQLREELVRRVLDELPQELGSGGAAQENAAAAPADLLRGVSAIHAGTTQKEILRALLDGLSHYCGRTALFVIRGGTSTGWQGRGFEDNDAVKEFALNTSRGLPDRVLQEKAAFSGQVMDMDPRFVDHFGSPADDHIIMLPLLLKDKVAALVYADSGLDAGPRLDSAAIELLVVSASAWLELTSARKQAPRDAGAYAENVPAAPPLQTVSSFSDPFASHSPKHRGAAAAAPAYAPQAAPEPAQAEVVSAAAASAYAPGAPSAGGGGATLSEEDAETHRKAQRFARLLVDEIKLYNQAKVTEGRKNKDLYDRLKEDIDKSRSTYKKRYGNTAAASTDYFQAELVRSLAEDDISIMGANFRR